MSNFRTFAYDPAQQPTSYVTTVTPARRDCPSPAQEMINWCYDHGAILYPAPSKSDAKIVVEGSYFDFYDEELYIMFKLKWG